MTITLDQANSAIAAAVNKAEELKIQISIAVCDAGGRLVAFARMDGAGWAGVYGAQGKAIASAATGSPSGRIPEDLHVMQKINEHAGGVMIYSQGGMPVIQEDRLIGAIGTGGGTAEQDEECAAAGAAAIN